jgi:hypothetical protein
VASENAPEYPGARCLRGTEQHAVRAIRHAESYTQPRLTSFLQLFIYTFNCPISSVSDSTQKYPTIHSTIIPSRARESHDTMATSIFSRKRDLVYLIYFCISVPMTFSTCSKHIVSPPPTTFILCHIPPFPLGATQPVQKTILMKIT